MSKQHPHIKALRAHNKWRRGDARTKMGDPKEIGAALDWAIKVAELAQKYIGAKPNASGEFYERLESAVKEGGNEMA